MLPVLVFPFATLAFWALGGGSGNAAMAGQSKGGMNVEVPGANNKEEPVDKMGFYTQAEKDEQERTKMLKNDPYSQLQFDTTEAGMPGGESVQTERAIQPFGAGAHGAWEDGNEKKLYQKLGALQQALKEQPSDGPPTAPLARYRTDAVPASADMKRLEEMMDRMNDKSGAEDPEMKQVNAVLENILDLQHPERVQQRIKKTSQENRGNVYAVTVPSEPVPLSTLGQDRVSLGLRSGGTNGFFGLENPYQETAEAVGGIRAVVHQDQTLVSGSTIKLRLVDPVYINGSYIPKDQFVFGKVSLSGERLEITIESIRHLSNLFPVELNVFDMDGLEGIYIPGAITRDVAKQSGDRSMQNIGLTTFDPSLGAQAASAGIELSKNLFSKKIKLVKVMVKAGYQVILIDHKQQKNR